MEPKKISSIIFASAVVIFLLWPTDPEPTLKKDIDQNPLAQIHTIGCIKNIISDPDSYETIFFAPYVRLRDGNYVVTDKFRAKNEFGAYEIYIWDLLVDENATIIGVKDHYRGDL